MYSVLNRIGWNSSPSEVKKMIDSADTNKNGFVEFEEFINMVDVVRKREEQQLRGKKLKALSIANSNQMFLKCLIQTKMDSWICKNWEESTMLLA